MALLWQARRVYEIVRLHHTSLRDTQQYKDYRFFNLAFSSSTVSPQTLIIGWMWSEGWTPPSRRSRYAFILERIGSVKLRLNWIPFECDPFSRASWWNCKKRWNQKSLPLRWSTSQTGRTTSCLFFFVQIFFAIMADVPKGRIQSSTSIMSCPN